MCHYFDKVCHYIDLRDLFIVITLAEMGFHMPLVPFRTHRKAFCNCHDKINLNFKIDHHQLHIASVIMGQI